MRSIRKYFKTLFPRFDEESVAPDLEELSCSDSTDWSDDNSVNREKYTTKQDEDIAVFLSLTKQMSVKSLVFLLQNHARAMLIPQADLQQSLQQHQSSTTRLTGPTRGKRPPPKKEKHFRFAEIQGGQKVRVLVREFSKSDPQDRGELWWTEAEQREMRLEALRTVRYFRRNKRGYSESVKILAESAQEDADDLLVDHHMKKLTEDSYARGLESHIVSMLSKLRKHTVWAVLNEQTACSGKPYTTSCECLRARSIVASEPGRTLAAKMAECDHVEALKASLSKWDRPTIPIPSQQSGMKQPSRSPPATLSSF
jgi:hypothetical protein